MGSEVRSGIGARLKAGRERLGMTLLQVAEKLHVDAKVLEALEAERFEELGAPVYSKGHIKRYAEITGEDTAQLLDLYAQTRKPALPDLTHIPKAASHHTDPRKLVLPSLVVLIAFALIGSVWWVLQNLDSAPVSPKASEGGSDSATLTPDPQQEVPVETPPAAPIADPARAVTPPAVREQARPSAPASPPSSPLPASATPSPRGSGTRAGTSAGAESTAKITKTTRLPPAAPTDDAPRGKTVSVTLRFAADSWVEVYDANGQRLFYDIGAAKSSHSVSGVPPLRVVLGSAPAVSLRVNGKRVAVPASAVHEDSAQFSINGSGRIVRAQSEGAASPASKPNGE
jgi:cytoskeleton protein RodZ